MTEFPLNRETYIYKYIGKTVFQPEIILKIMENYSKILLQLNLKEQEI